MVWWVCAHSIVVCVRTLHGVVGVRTLYCGVCAHSPWWWWVFAHSLWCCMCALSMVVVGVHTLSTVVYVHPLCGGGCLHPLCGGVCTLSMVVVCARSKKHFFSCALSCSHDPSTSRGCPVHHHHIPARVTRECRQVLWGHVPEQSQPHHLCIQGCCRRLHRGRNS